MEEEGYAEGVVAESQMVQRAERALSIAVAVRNRIEQLRQVSKVCRPCGERRRQRVIEQREGDVIGVELLHALGAGTKAAPMV